MRDHRAPVQPTRRLEVDEGVTRRRRKEGGGYAGSIGQKELSEAEVRRN